MWIDKINVLKLHKMWCKMKHCLMVVKNISFHSFVHEMKKNLSIHYMLLKPRLYVIRKFKHSWIQQTHTYSLRPYQVLMAINMGNEYAERGPLGQLMTVLKGWGGM